MLWQVAAMRESRNELVQVSCFWKAEKFGQNFHQLLMLLRIKSRLGHFLSQRDNRAGTGILHVPHFSFADLQLGSKSVANIHTHILLFLSFLIKPYLTALSPLFYAFLKVLLPLAPLLNSLFSCKLKFLVYVCAQHRISSVTFHFPDNYNKPQKNQQEAKSSGEASFLNVNTNKNSDQKNPRKNVDILFSGQLDIWGTSNLMFASGEKKKKENNQGFKHTPSKIM